MNSCLGIVGCRETGLSQTRNYMNPLQQLKQRQIASLQPFNPRDLGVREGIQSLSIPVYLSTLNLSLVIVLPRLFPQDSAIFYVDGGLRHDWILEDNGFHARQVSTQQLPRSRIIPQKLPIWSPQASLGKVVEGILLEFTLRPPTINRARGSQEKLGSDKDISPTRGEVPVRPVEPTARSYNKPIPTPEALIPNLDSLTNQEVQNLLTDQVTFTDFFYSLPQVASIRQTQEEFLSKNSEAAKINIEKARQIEELMMKMKALEESNVEARRRIDLLLIDHRDESQVCV